MVFGETLCTNCGEPITTTKYLGFGTEFYHFECPDIEMDKTVMYERE